MTRRREFLKRSALGAAAGAATIAAPAVVRAQPTLNWRMPSSFPKSLETLYGSAEQVCRRVAEMSNGKFNIRPFAGGEIVPPLAVLDAVQNATVEIGHTAPYYYIGKDPTWAFGTIVPFGLNARQFNSWWYAGGGDKLFNEFTQANGIVTLPAGNTGAQMGGFFRKEIKSIKDLEGLKFRIAGLGGQLMAKLGAVPQQIAGAEIYPALEKGTIDAAEWVGPHDDEKLGLGKVAKFYYYPGFWEGSAAVHCIVNKKAWDELPKEYQSMLETACGEANAVMLARYDALNGAAVRRLIAQGVQLRAFPRDVMEAGYKAAQDLYAEFAAKSASFKKVSDGYFEFQRETIPWFRVTENTFDDFMASIKK
jgi:TRAP-type mannitol/chloroaromatic compound transport system substrate-binding protein